MSYITLPYLALGESVKARIERLHYHGEDLESQCRDVIDNYQGGAAQLYERLNDIIGNFYDRGLVDHLDWQLWKHDLVSRWWLGMELDDDSPIATHQLTLESGVNKRYLRGVGWVWFRWDEEETTTIPRRVVPHLDGLLVLDPRSSPWEVRQPLSIPQPKEGHPHVPGGVKIPPTFRRQMDLRWGHIDALNYPGLMELVRPGPFGIIPKMETIHQYRYAIVPEWERLAYNWCSVLGTEWLNRLDNQLEIPLDYIVNPDLIWQNALVFACQTLGIDYVAWALEAFPEAIFLSQLTASSLLMANPVMFPLLDLSPQGRVVVIQRVIQECSHLTRPFMGENVQLPKLAMFERMQLEVPREHTSDYSEEQKKIEETVSRARDLLDLLLEPFMDNPETTTSTDAMSYNPQENQI